MTGWDLVVMTGKQGSSSEEASRGEAGVSRTVCVWVGEGVLVGGPGAWS